jgi:phosphoribosylglycinamide formyltransferase 2
VNQVEGVSAVVTFAGLEVALAEAVTQIRLFGKPRVLGERRKGVALAFGHDVADARARAARAASAVTWRFDDG